MFSQHLAGILTLPVRSCSFLLILQFSLIKAITFPYKMLVWPQSAFASTGQRTPVVQLLFTEYIFETSSDSYCTKQNKTLSFLMCLNLLSMLKNLHTGKRTYIIIIFYNKCLFMWGNFWHSYSKSFYSSYAYITPPHGQSSTE